MHTLARNLAPPSAAGLAHGRAVIATGSCSVSLLTFLRCS